MIGQEYLALKTERNRKNGIDAGAICLIRFVDVKAVSVEVRGANRNSFPKYVVPKDVFGSNFEPRKDSTPYRGAPLSSHFTKRYA